MKNLNDILVIPCTKKELYSIIKKRISGLYKESLEKKIEYILKNLPEMKSDILRQAELAMEGRLILPGTGGKPYFTGNPPAWFKNPVGDKEYVWGLNRTPHWKTLLEAYCLTKESKFAEKVVSELVNWLKSCPRPEIDKNPEKAHTSFCSVDPWRCLEVGIRMFEYWPLVVKYLIGTDYFSPELLEKYVVSVYEHGEVLEEISPVLLPNANNNHYLMENLGLLTIACDFPEMNKSRQWIAHSMKELERCAAVQITNDGGQIEGCPGYHNICVSFFCISILIARENGLFFSSEYKEKILKSLDYSIYSFRPSGTIVPFGDSDADKSAVNSALLGYLAFEEIKWLKILKDIMGYESIVKELNRYIWEIPDMEDLLSKLKYDKPTDTLNLYNWQHELSQAVMRTDWTRDALSVFFSCRTPVNNGHAHIDLMSFDFTAYGKALIVDPGRFTYREDLDRRLFKSATMHNTLTIDNMEPFEYISSWEFMPQKEGRISCLYKGEGYVAAEAFHLNYEPMIHKRLVALVNSSFLIVLDQIDEIDDGKSVQIYYHLDSRCVLVENDQYRIRTNDEDVNILIQTSSNMEGILMDGRISEVVDISRPSTRVCFSDTAKEHGTRCFATVLVPFRFESTIPALSRIEVEKYTDYNLYKFTCSARQYQFIWGRDKFVMF